MKVLLVGSGGREHALAWKLAQSPQLSRLLCAPGNAGIADCATCIDVAADDVEGLLALARREAVDLVVVGPEAPLVAGLADRLAEAGIAVFGPSARAAQLEGSKGFTKELCARTGIPTAAFERFDNAADAQAYVHDRGAPIVVKADGLAAGKGVTVAMTVEEAEAAIDDIFDGRFGEAGAEVVVEDCLEGEEASFFALCDGTTALPLATAQDHKRVGDADTGPNTGGMGAYSPAPVMTQALIDEVMDRIIQPTLAEMKLNAMPYTGVLYAGLMIGRDGPQLIEYNARFGDPECQVLMMRLESDLLDLLHAAATGSLDGRQIVWRDEAALTVVMAAKGYPGTYDKGSEIRGLEAAAADPDVEIFHAGTTAEENRILATGGRVLNVTARGATVAQAQARAYAAVDRIDWPGGFCRRDIGWRAVDRERR